MAILKTLENLIKVSLPDLPTWGLSASDLRPSLFGFAARMLVNKEGSTFKRVDVTADNQVINPSGYQYLRLFSDNATATNRTILLKPGDFRGHILILESAQNAVELADGGSVSGGSGTVKLVNAWAPTAVSFLTLLWDGTNWNEISRGIGAGVDTFSAFALTLLDDADADAARGTLEIPKIVHATATLTSAAAATPVSLVANAAVPAGKKCYLVPGSILARVNGATNWATTATVKIQDTEGTPVDFVTYAVAALTGNTTVFPHTTNVTLESALLLGTGGTAARGLQIVGDANGTGSDLVVTATVVIKA